MERRPLYVIAREIHRACRDKSWYYAAMPYVRAMTQLSDISESYGYDTGDSVVRYALSNLTSWRGDDARRVKAELRAML